MAKTQREGSRIERDSMGEMEVPAEAYYGAQTARAVENFPVSGLRFGRRFIKALGLVKAAAAHANAELGLLDSERAGAIASAAGEVAEGMFDKEFVVDIFQTGSGTSTNMNANEVISSRAAELLGRERGDKNSVHPNDHVNMGQSTNDVFPTAIHVAAMEAVKRELVPALESLAEAFESKAEEFSGVVKSGRTHLQDAVPITLGQEFSGYASVVRHGLARVEAAVGRLAELAIGGTALGTGLNADPRYAELVVAELNRQTGLGFCKAENLFEAMQNRDAAVEMSGVLKTIAVGLLKISNDLRLMSSGPRTGLGEIALPEIQPGSSIMPGKVNPVIPEAVTMVAAQVIGNDTTIAIAGLNGNLDLNVMMPVIARDLLESIEILAGGVRVLAAKCVVGITANSDRCLALAEMSATTVTAVAPEIGYDEAARVFKKAIAEDKSVRDVILEDGLLDQKRLDEVLDLINLTKGGRP
ncbi:MAG: class II fumarate hydratase [Deltaproteobacteria bacterium]